MFQYPRGISYVWLLRTYSLRPFRSTMIGYGLQPSPVRPQRTQEEDSETNDEGWSRRWVEIKGWIYVHNSLHETMSFQTDRRRLRTALTNKIVVEELDTGIERFWILNGMYCRSQTSKITARIGRVSDKVLIERYGKVSRFEPKTRSHTHMAAKEWQCRNWFCSVQQTAKQPSPPTTGYRTGTGWIGESAVLGFLAKTSIPNEMSKKKVLNTFRSAIRVKCRGILALFFDNFGRILIPILLGKDIIEVFYRAGHGSKWRCDDDTLDRLSIGAMSWL